MAPLSGADECVVRAIESLDHGLEARNITFDELLWGKLLHRRGLQHFNAVLVGASEEEHLVTIEPHETGDRIGCDRLVCVADVRRAIRVGDGGGDIIAGLFGHRSVPSGAFGNDRKGRDTGVPAGPRPGRDALSLRYQRRDASASQPNTSNTSGLRSRLNSSASQAAVLIFSHTSANRARWTTDCPPAVSRAWSHPFTVSTKAASGAGSTPSRRSPSA